MSGGSWLVAPADHEAARGSNEVRRLAAATPDLAVLDARVAACRACPRLVAWRERVAREKRAAFADQTYWGRPVPGWGAADARVAVLGLAPAAHGGNRTGRVFTGDRSGDGLALALYRAGLARLPTSRHVGDGQQPLDTRILAAVRCAPPDNAPTPEERAACQPWMERELALLLPSLRVIVVLGGFAWGALWPTLADLGVAVPRPRPRFGHGAEVALAGGRLTVLGCFHPSQQNTFTGRLTQAMLDDLFARAARVAGLGERGAAG